MTLMVTPWSGRTTCWPILRDSTSIPILSDVGCSHFRINASGGITSAQLSRDQSPNHGNWMPPWPATSLFIPSAGIEGRRLPQKRRTRSAICGKNDAWTLGEHSPCQIAVHFREEAQVAKLSQFRATVVLAEDVEIPCCRPDLDDCNRKVSENGQQPRGRASCGLGRATLINNDLREFPRRQRHGIKGSEFAPYCCRRSPGLSPSTAVPAGFRACWRSSQQRPDLEE